MSSARVLVVEDESVTAMDIEERLQRLGYSVLAVVSSGEEAIRKVEETHPDLVLMDIKLSGDTDGVQAAQDVQSRLGVPIVYLTAFSDNATWDRVKSTEPFGYLVKPVKDRDLETSIEIALRRREAEKRLLDRERWIGQFADCSGIAMMTFDQNGLVTFMNSAARELTGWEQRDAFGTHVTRVFDLQEGETAFSTVARALKRDVEAGSTYNARLIAKDRREAPVQYSVAPITDKEGNNAGAILFFQAVDRAQLDETAQQEPMSVQAAPRHDSGPDAAEGERRESLRVIEALVRKSPLATVVLDAEGRVRMCNGAFEDLFLYSQQEIVGSELEKLILVKETEAESFEVSKGVLCGQALQTTGFRRRKDGKLVVVELYSVPVFLHGSLRAVHVSYQDITQRMWEEGQLRQQATSDPLTGLANCRWFIDVLTAEIKRSQRTGRTLAVLLLDLDDLKKINDRYGHSVGNRALCRLADILRTHCRALDTASRYGGDEFALILLDAGEAAASHVARRISEQLAIGSENPPLTVSVGVAVYPQDGDTADTLLGAADRALYEMKRRRGYKISKLA